MHGQQNIKKQITFRPYRGQLMSLYSHKFALPPCCFYLLWGIKKWHWVYSNNIRNILITLVCDNLSSGSKYETRQTHWERDTHTDTHTDAHTNTDAHKRTHTDTHRCTHTHTHRCTHTHTHTHTDAHTHAHADAHTQTHTDAHTHTQMNTHTHRCTQTRAHAHTHTHTHTQRSSCHKPGYIYFHLEESQCTNNHPNQLVTEEFQNVRSEWIQLQH